MNFLKRLFGQGCSHRFTWPRIDANGRHYQTMPTSVELHTNMTGE